MNQILESFKKIGAYLIVLALILTMGITFSSQDTSEILYILMGGSKIGSYDGEEVRPEVYRFAEDSCKSRYQVMGEIPQVFIDRCTVDTVRQLMVMPAIAADLGLDVSEQSIQEQIVSTLRTRLEMENRNRLPDDRLSLEKAVQLEVARYPISLRRRLSRVGLAEEALSGLFPVSAAEGRALAGARNSSLALQVVAFTNTDLLESFTAEASQEEIRELYEKEKKEAEIRHKKEKKDGPFSYPSLEERKEFLKDRIVTEKKKKQLEELKASLSQGKDLDLAAVAQKTGHRPQRVVVKFNGLNAVALPSGSTINLSGDRFLADLASGREGLLGPYQDGETTVYLTVEDVKLGKVVDPDAEIVQERSQYLAYAFANYILNEYAEAGNFQMVQKSLDFGTPR